MVVTTCKGITKQGAPCRIYLGLDAYGFCKYHAPENAPCRGIARSTGQRCRIKWDLNAQGYCKHHAGAATSRQCTAIARSTGQRCRVTFGIDEFGLCSVHQKGRTAATEPSAIPLRPQCQGVLVHTGEPCRNNAKPNYAYCCAAHDPSLPYYSPRLFDSGEKTRAYLEPQIVELYDNKDLYHGDPLDLTTPGFVELDHILEKQCFSYSFQRMTFRDQQEDPRYLASIVRDEFANELVNLCLTRTPTNKIKGAAVWKYLDDAVTGHLRACGDATSFTDYMLAEHRDGTRLGRGTTRIIVREMGRSLRTCQYKLADEGDTPLLDSLSTQLQQLFVDMELHVAASVVSKWDSQTKPHHPNDCESASESGYTGSDHCGEPTVQHTTKTLADAVNAAPFEPRISSTEEPVTAPAPSTAEPVQADHVDSIKDTLATETPKPAEEGPPSTDNECSSEAVSMISTVEHAPDRTSIHRNESVEA